MKAPNCWWRGCSSRRCRGALCRHGLRKTRFSEADREWLAAKGVHVQFRASLEQDLAAMHDVQARPCHRHHAGGAEGQAASIPALYFTNLISARPLMGAAGAGSLVQVVNAAIANKARFDEHDGLL
jgi:chlorophyllide a reductase subunit Y